MRLSSMPTVLLFLSFRIKVKRRIRIRIRIKVMRICNTAQNRAVDTHNGGLEGRRFLSLWWETGSGTALKWKAGSRSALKWKAGYGSESALKQCGSATLILRFIGNSCPIFRKWSQLQEWVIQCANDSCKRWSKNTEHTKHEEVLKFFLIFISC